MARITACSTLGYCDFPIETAAEQIAARGFSRIEIGHMHHYCRHYTPGAENSERLRRLFDRLNLTPVAMNYALFLEEQGTPVFPDFLNRRHIEQSEDQIRCLLKDLVEIGVPLLNINTGRCTEADDRPRRVEASSAFVSRMGEFAAEQGIRLTLEVPHCYLLYNNVERVAETFSQITSKNVGALVDSSHWTLLEYDLDTLWEAVGGKVWHVHLRDARRETTDDEQQLELTAGRGECDFSTFANWLEGHEYQGEVSIEFEYRGPEMPLDKIEAEYDYGLPSLAQQGWTLPELLNK